jgi:hypothetical protein
MSTKMDLGNKVALEGCTRCDCGCKYWENDRCVDCGSHVESIALNADQILAAVPTDYRWADACESEEWADLADVMVQVIVGLDGDTIMTDLAIKDN